MSTIWDWLWVLWLGAFLAIEIPGLVNHTENDTLSEHVWRWFGISKTGAGEERRTPTAGVRFRRFLLLSFCAWLVAHFLTGGFF